jgi:cytochrome c
MKRIATTLVVLAMMLSTAAFAADGATIFHKCAMCHGPNGEGKIGPKIAGLPADKVTEVLSKGGLPKAPHKTPFAGLSADDIAAVATYVSGLK